MNMKEKLESLGKNSISLKIARKETYKLGATRFGGKPDVPPDFVWPTYEGESYDHVVKNRPLTFLAQFNCEELAQFDKEHLLPDHGLLSFFYETDTVKVIVKQRMKQLAIGDNIRVYVFEKTPVYDQEQCKLLCSYLALEKTRRESENGDSRGFIADSGGDQETGSDEF